MVLALSVGAVLALSIGLSATFLGLDRDRAFYPTVTIVIASYYALFAVMGGPVQALAAHGLFDFIHDRLIANPGVPAWWPAFCLAFDVLAAAYLAWLLSRSKIHAAADPLAGPGARRGY